MVKKGEVVSIIDSVIDIEGLIIKADEVLAKFIPKEIANEEIVDVTIEEAIEDSVVDGDEGIANEQIDGIFEVLKVGTNVKLYEVGQILVDFNDKVADFYKHGEDDYIVIGSYSIKLATIASNIKE